jgi:hypothetical protein
MSNHPRILAYWGDPARDIDRKISVLTGQRWPFKKKPLRGGGALILLLRALYKALAAYRYYLQDDGVYRAKSVPTAATTMPLAAAEAPVIVEHAQSMLPDWPAASATPWMKGDKFNV